MEFVNILLCFLQKRESHVFPPLWLAHDRPKPCTNLYTRATLPFGPSVASAPPGDAVTAVGTKPGATAAGLSGKFSFIASVTVGGTGHTKPSLIKHSERS